MTDNQEPLKTLRSDATAIVTKGTKAGRFVRLVRESSYTRGKIVWIVEYVKKKFGDESNPRFNEDMLLCVSPPFEAAIAPDIGDKCILIGDQGLVDNWRMIVISVEPTAEIMLEDLDK